MSGLGQSSLSQAASIATTAATAAVTPDVPSCSVPARYGQVVNYKACLYTCNFKKQSEENARADWLKNMFL